MTTREKWLLGLMATAMIYGGFTLVTRAMRSDTTGVATDELLPDARQFADAARQSLAELHLTTEEEFVLDKLVSPWPGSPFFERSEPTQAVAAKVKELRYTGYFHLGAVRLAIINGREYRVNETIEATDLLVEDIEPDRVVLASQGGARRVTIALQETAKYGEKP